MANEERKPVKYIAREVSNINNEMIQVGQEVFYAGLPGPNLQPTDAEGEARVKEYEQAEKDRQKTQAEENPESAVGNPEAFAAALGKELQRQKEESDRRFAEMQASAAQDRELFKEILRGLQAGTAKSDIQDPTAAPVPAQSPAQTAIQSQSTDEGKQAAADIKHAEEKASAKGKHKE